MKMRFLSFMMIATVVIGMVTLISILCYTSALALPVLTLNYQLLDVSASGKKLYVLYDHNGLSFTSSSDGEITFGKPIEIDDTIYKYLGPATMTADGNNIYILWQGRTNSSHQVILFTKSSDGGKTFGPSTIIGRNDTYYSLPSGLAVAGSHVYTTMINEYLKEGYPYGDVSIRASSDNGTTFGKSIDLANSTQVLPSPPPVQIQVSDSGKTIYVVSEYSPDQIFFEKSDDYGTSFSLPKVVYSSKQPIEEFRTHASGNNLYIVWSERPTAINFIKSNDRGQTFSEPEDLTKGISVGKTISLGGLGLASSENNVYIIWGYVSYDNPPSLFLIRSKDGGDTFANPVNLTGNYGFGTFDVAASGDSLYLAWSTYQHRSEKTDILFEKSADNGTTFDHPINISANVNEDSMNPKLVTTGNNVYVAWGTYFPGDYLVVGASGDNGTTFANIMDLGTVSQTTVPEFPFAVPVLLSSIVSLIILTKLKLEQTAKK